MAETVNALTVSVSLKGTVAGTDGALLKVDIVKEITFSDGTGTNQIGSVWQDLSRPLNATSEDLNLDGLSDFQGATNAITNVGVFYMENLDEDTGDKFTIGGASGNQFVGMITTATGTVDIGPGGFMLWVSPVDKGAITATTGDLLKVLSADNSTYKILVGGDNA